MMITAVIEHQTEDRCTQVYGKNINEILEKIKSFHELGAFEVEYFTKKGKLKEEKASGWYLQ